MNSELHIVLLILGSHPAMLLALISGITPGGVLGPFGIPRNEPGSALPVQASALPSVSLYYIVQALDSF